MHKFPLGQILMTPGIAALGQPELLIQLLQRHVVGDWGDLCADDVRENELSLANGYRLLSAYKLTQPDVTVWLITEADRSATTFLLPEEY